MAIGLILDWPEGTREQYDGVVAKMGLGGQLPPGSVMHVAAPGPNGGWRVIDAWESPEAFEQFAEEQIRPFSQEMGMDEPQVTMFEIHQTRDSGRPRTEMEFFQVVSFDDLDEDGFVAMDAEIIGEGDAPEAIVFHINGPTADGGWIVADGWRTKDERDVFMEERVGPVAGRSDAPPPKIEEHSVHNTLDSGG